MRAPAKPNFPPVDIAHTGQSFAALSGGIGGRCSPDRDRRQASQGFQAADMSSCNLRKSLTALQELAFAIEIPWRQGACRNSFANYLAEL